MVKTSTFIYLMDDLNTPADMILTTDQDPILHDEIYASFLNMLEVDPGEDLVVRTLEKLEER